jgi:hypothetical protein
VNPCPRTEVVATINPAANQGLAVSAGPAVCSGVNGTITVASSESGISYQAYKGATAVGTAVVGTGNDIALTIPSANLTAGANTITIQATKTGCGTVTLTNSAVITVNSAAAPTITFANINRTFGDAAVTLTATSPSAGAFTYSIVNSTPTGIASLAGNQITMTGAGTVNLKVDQPANGCYLAGTANATLTIAKANRTVTITSPNSGQAGTTVNLTHTANPAGGTATWSVTGTGANVTGTTLNLTAAGTVTVKVDIAADANYNAASATQTFTISAATSPTIVFNDINKVYGDVPFNLAATSNSSGAFTYSIVNSTPSNIVNLTGNQITINGAGTVTIKVDQAASSPFGVGSKTITLTIAKANRTVSITSPNSGQTGSTVNLTHTANPAGGTATWSVTGAGASVSGTVLNLNAAGTVTVKVDIAADANYNAASATQTFTINSAADPTIVFNDLTKTYGDADFNLSATSNSSGALTYSLFGSTPANIVTVSSSGLVHITGAGTATIRVEQAASAPYGIGSKTISLTINKAVRTISITSASSGQVGTTVNLTNTMNPAGGTATWSVTPVTGTATVSGSTLNLTGAGTVTVKVDVAADANYLAATATQTFTVNGASSPTITFNNVTKTYGDASFSMTASSPSLGAMTYSVQSSTPANIVTITSAGQVTILGAGTAVIKVDQVANGTYSAGSATATLTINKATRSIAITSANSGQVGTTVNLTSTQNPTGGIETWSVTPGTGAATLTGTTLNLTSAGTVTVKVDVAAEANYLAASATQTFTINPGTAPTITFTDITKTFGDAAFNLAAVSTSPGALTYSLVSSIPTSIVTVSTAGLVTISGAGTATIKVDQAASGTFAAASKTITLTINKATRTINITSVSNGPVGTTVSLAYTATPASTAGVWSVTPGTGSATISGSTLNLVGAGTVNVKVDIAADANYLASSATQVFIINSGSSPVITFNNVTKTYGDPVFNMSATSTSGGAMTYTVANSTPTGIVSITPAGQVTILGAGTATIQVDQAADGTFSAGSATATLTINKANRTITITSPSSGNVGIAVTLAATVAPTGTIVWSVSNVSGAATVSGTTLNLTSPGTVTVRADIAGDANFNASFATQTFTINSGSAPTITFNGLTKTFGDASFSMTATSPSAGAMTYSVQSSIPSNIVTITPAGQVTILGAGTAVIKVDQVANGTYSAGSATATLTINKATRSVIITSASSGQIGTTVNLAHTANPTGGVATWSVTNVTGNATISGTTLNLIAAGTVTVKVDIAAEANYLAGTATQTFTINAGNAPVITYNNITKVFGDAPFNMTATSTSAGAMTYSVENSIPSNIVTITSSGQVTILGAGTATIKVNQVANGTFAAGSATAVLTINKATRNVTITSASSGQVGTSVILNSLVSPTGGTPTWSVTPGTGSATISGTTMNLVSAGTVTVKVDVAADANYSAATATQTFTINPGTTPSITLGNQFKVFGNAPFTVNATSNSPGAKTYSLVSSVPTGIVTVSPTGLITILGAGTATIKVDQAASGSFGAGSATATITIAKANRTVTITSSNSGDAGTNVNLAHSVSVGAGVATWTVTNNTGAATVSGTSLSLTTAGLVTVKVTVEADANYNAATASQFFTINPPSDTPNPGTISGPTSVTKGNTYVYCVTNVPGTSYTWSYNGAGVTMINSTSNCVTISYSAFATPGTLSVVADIDGSGPKTPSSPSSISITVDGTTAVVKELEGVTLEAYPNPFEFASRIEFNLNSGSTVNLEVYNMLGFKVKTILDEETLGAGQHDYELSDLANGVYIVRLKIGNKEKNIKVIKH